MIIGKQAVYRTLVGAALKSVGCTARIMDVPSDVDELKKKVIQREAILLGTMAAFSLALEVLFKYVKPPSQGFPVLQFIPQLLAYIFAEWLSRRMTGYTHMLHNTLMRPGNMTPVSTVSQVAKGALHTAQALPIKVLPVAKQAHVLHPTVSYAYSPTAYAMYGNAYYAMRPF